MRIVGKRSKQQWADAIVAAVQVAADAEANAEKPRQDGEVSAKGGRGRVNKIKIKAVEEGKKRDIGKRTIERALTKANGKKAKVATEPKRKAKPEGKRTTSAKRERYGFVNGFMASVHGLGMVAFSNDALDFLTAEQSAVAIEDIDVAIATLITLRSKVDPCQIDLEDAERLRRPVVQ